MSYRSYVLLIAAGAVGSAAACSTPTTVCAGLERVGETLPDTTTIKVGATIIATAGVGYGICVGEPEHPPPRQYVWKVSDSSVVNVTVIDSIHARIMGLSPGHAIVTPVYKSGGDGLTSVAVTVVP